MKTTETEFSIKTKALMFLKNAVSIIKYRKIAHQNHLELKDEGVVDYIISNLASTDLSSSEISPDMFLDCFLGDMKTINQSLDRLGKSFFRVENWENDKKIVYFLNILFITLTGLIAVNPPEEWGSFEYIISFTLFVKLISLVLYDFDFIMSKKKFDSLSEIIGNKDLAIVINDVKNFITSGNKSDLREKPICRYLKSRIKDLDQPA